MYIYYFCLTGYRPNRPGFDYNRPGYSGSNFGFPGSQYRPGYNQYRPGFDRPYSGNPTGNYYSGFGDGYDNFRFLGRKVADSIKENDEKA